MSNEFPSRVDPVEPAHIAISKSRGMTIDWVDGHKSVFSVAFLRDNCPCAACTGAEGGEPQRTSYQNEAKAADNNPFQMFKPVLKMLAVNEVGAYAVRMDWSDGHKTGIYSFRHLRRVCPCAECVALVAQANKL